jgi:hypothetical protein
MSLHGLLTGMALPVYLYLSTLVKLLWSGACHVQLMLGLRMRGDLPPQSLRTLEGRGEVFFNIRWSVTHVLYSVSCIRILSRNVHFPINFRKQIYVSGHDPPPPPISLVSALNDFSQFYVEFYCILTRGEFFTAYTGFSVKCSSYFKQVLPEFCYEDPSSNVKFVRLEVKLHYHTKVDWIVIVCSVD